MTTSRPTTLEGYLALEYPFHVIADPDGGYVATFPDLPGCATQVETLEELPAMVGDVRRLWIATAFDHGIVIPLPSHPEEYSGKFNLRLPRSLHRSLAEEAERQGVSLNQHVVALLAERNAQARIERRLDALDLRLRGANERKRFQTTGLPTTRSGPGNVTVVQGSKTKVAV